MHAGVGVCRPGAAPFTGRIPTLNFAACFLDRFNPSVSARISSSQQLSTDVTCDGNEISAAANYPQV